MNSTYYTYLKFTRFKDILFWDIKRYQIESVNSKYTLVALSDLIVDEKTKFDISNPLQQYGILGVNNKIGIFDAYIENGANIKQKYKRMETGWIAYNPYRINVGSIGIKQDYHKHKYISPAYVVFRCGPRLLPEFLYLVMRSTRFNSIIRENTTGSVRQTLSFKSLSKLSIPLPSLKQQEGLISDFKAKIQETYSLDQKAIAIDEDNNAYLKQQLGATIIKESYDIREGYKYLHFAHFRSITEWGTDIILKKQKQESFKYPIAKIKDLCHLGSGGTPSRSNSEYYNGSIPWVKTGEVVNDEILETEEHITKEAIANSSAKLYPKGSLIIAMYGQGDTRGRTAKLGIDATTNQACAVLYDIDNSIVSTDYLWYYLQGQYHDLRSLASGNNQPNLNAGKIKNYGVVVPPMEIQNEIVDHIKKQKAIAKELRQRAQKMREEALKEFETKIFE